MLNFSAPDLTQHPPRSPHVRLGGYVHFPRLLDKARAHLAGHLGEYIWHCMVDKHFFAFTGADPDALLAAVKSGLSDTQMLAWLSDHQPVKRLPYEIAAWSTWLTELSPGGPGLHASFAEVITAQAPQRGDIRTIFDRLDMEDYAAFGGRP
jgi:hypothetical protein